MGKKIVLQIGPLPPPSGGIASQIELIRGIDSKKLGYEVKIFNTSIQQRFSETGMLTFANIYKTIQQIFFLFITFLLQEVDFVHIHISVGYGFVKNSIFLQISKMFRKKVILHIHGGDFDIWYSGLNSFKQNLVKKTLASSNSIIVLGKYWYEFFENKVGVGKNKMTILENAVVLEEKKNSEINQKRNPIVFLFVGAVGKRKGVFDIVEAVRILINFNKKDFVILIVGDEEFPGEMKLISEFVEKNNLNNFIMLKGERSKSEVWEFYHHSDIFLLPSYAEGLPVSILEAMACSKAIITTNVGSIGEVIQNNINGIIVNPGNANNLAEAMFFLYENEEKRVKLGIAAYQLYKERFSQEVYVRNLSQIYDTL